MMTKELIENVEKLSEVIADVANASTPVIGVGVGFGAVAVTAWDLGDWIMIALKVLARIALYNSHNRNSEFNKRNIRTIVAEKRDHLGMTFRRMFERSCQHLGLRFYSDIKELIGFIFQEKTKKADQMVKPVFLRIVNQYTHSVI
jgi:hypothetical protein